MPIITPITPMPTTTTTTTPTTPTTPTPTTTPLTIIPIIATNPLIQNAVEAKIFDTWFLTDFRLVANQDRKFDIEAFWTLGRLYKTTKETVTSISHELTSTQKNVYIQDILSNYILTKYPEIATIMPLFLNALETIGKKEGSL